MNQQRHVPKKAKCPYCNNAAERGANGEPHWKVCSKNPASSIGSKPKSKRKKKSSRKKRKASSRIGDGGEWWAVGNETIPKNWPNAEQIAAKLSGSSVQKPLFGD